LSYGRQAAWKIDLGEKVIELPESVSDFSMGATPYEFPQRRRGVGMWRGE